MLNDSNFKVIIKETHHQRRKRLGVCVRCGRSPVQGKTMCQKHIDDVSARRSKRINNALCSYCGNSCEIGKTICDSCSRKRAEQREERKAAGLCVMPGCHNDSRDGKVLCQDHADKSAEKTRELKQTVLDHYGQACNCPCGCKVTKYEYLTIDHKNNDGASQRKEQGTNAGGHATYRRIIKAGFPDDLQVLCWNCNCAKEYYGGCNNATT